MKAILPYIPASPLPPRQMTGQAESTKEEIVASVAPATNTHRFRYPAPDQSSIELVEKIAKPESTSSLSKSPVQHYQDNQQLLQRENIDAMFGINLYA